MTYIEYIDSFLQSKLLNLKLKGPEKSTSYPRILVIQKTKHTELDLGTGEKVRGINDFELTTLDCISNRT